MMPDELDARLRLTLEDRRLSRSERQGLVALANSSEVDREAIRRRAFEIAREAMTSPDDLARLGWLEEVLKATREGPAAVAARPVAEAYFSPGDDCPRAILRLLGGARASVDACVFTITDDRLSDGLLEAHARGVAVRVITDDAKADDFGSDVDRLAEAGIPVRVDRSPYHMHHKFAIVDGSTLLTGSYNWTRGAASDNEENLVVTDEPRLIGPFAATFDRLWSRLA